MQGKNWIKRIRIYKIN